MVKRTIIILESSILKEIVGLDLSSQVEYLRKEGMGIPLL